MFLGTFFFECHACHAWCTVDWYDRWFAHPHILWLSWITRLPVGPLLRTWSSCCTDAPPASLGYWSRVSPPIQLHTWQVYCRRCNGGPSTCSWCLEQQRGTSEVLICFDDDYAVLLVHVHFDGGGVRSSLVKKHWVWSCGMVDIKLGILVLSHISGGLFGWIALVHLSAGSEQLAHTYQARQRDHAFWAGWTEEVSSDMLWPIYCVNTCIACVQYIWLVTVVNGLRTFF